MSPLATALTTMRRSPYQSLAALFIVTLTFFVGYVFSTTGLIAQQVLKYFETRPQVIAFFELDAANSTVKDLAQKMESKSYVERVKIIDQEQALKLYREDNKDDPLLHELVTADILPASIEVSGQDVGSLAQIKEDLDKSEGVDEVILQQEIVDSLRQWTESLRYIGIGSIVILGSLSLLIIIIITGIRITTKRHAIQIMRMIGATKWYVKSPFVFEGMLYGLIGSLLGWCLMFVGLLYTTPWIQNFLGSVPVFPISEYYYMVQVSVGTLIGMILSALASDWAAGRMMKR